MSELRLPPCSLQLQVYIVNTPSSQQGEMRRRHLPMSHDRGEPGMSVECYDQYFYQLAGKILR